MAERPTRGSERRRTVKWIIVMILGFVSAIAGLWKLSKLIATEPRKR